ncbi:hypothetical protein D3C83_178180 [compost metagenome]
MAAAVDHLHFAMLGEGFDALAELVEYAVFPIAQFIEIYLGLAKGDAARGRFFALAQYFGGVEQGFRRNTADV